MNIVDVRANNAYHQIFSCIYKSLFVICTTGGPLEMRILVLGENSHVETGKSHKKKFELAEEFAHPENSFHKIRIPNKLNFRRTF